MRILIVSNLGLIRHTIEQTLDGLNHTLHLTESVPQAIELLHEHLRIDLIICEWSIRNLTAYDLFQGYRQIDRLSDMGETLPPHFLIFRTPDRITSNRKSTDRKDSRADTMQMLGCTEFLEKPIDRVLLLQRIHEIESERSGEPISLVARESSPSQRCAAAGVETRSFECSPIELPSEHSRSTIEFSQVVDFCRLLLSKIETIASELTEFTRTLDRFQKSHEIEHYAHKAVQLVEPTASTES